MTPSFPTRRSSDLGRPIASLGLGEILFLSSRYGIDPNIAPQASIGCVGAGPGLIADVRIVDHAYSCWITHHARRALSVRRENGRTCRLDLECLYFHQVRDFGWLRRVRRKRRRSEEHTSELQSLMRISYTVIFLQN